MAKKSRKRTTAPKPELLVFVACDAVSRDPNTEKVSLYGIFDRIWTDKFPCSHLRFSLFARISGQGEHPISFRFVPPDGPSRELTSGRVDYGKGAVIAMHFEVAGLEFKKQGEYQFVLRAGRKQIGRPLSIAVRRRRKKK